MKNFLLYFAVLFIGILVPQRSIKAQGGISTGYIARFQSYNILGYYIRHSNFRLKIDNNFTSLPYQDSQFKVVTGLADASYLSFESVNYPGYFIRHRKGEILLEKNDGTKQFKADATWKKGNGLANGKAASFESYNFPSQFIRHSNYLLYKTAIVSDLDRQDATFWYWTTPENGLVNYANYKIVSRSTGKVLGVTSTFGDVMEFTYNGSAFQTWSISPSVDPGTYIISSQGPATGFVLGFSANGGANTPLRVSSETTTTDSYQWKIVSVGNGYFQILAANGLSISVKDIGVVLSQYTNLASQQWQFVQLDAAKSAWRPAADKMEDVSLSLYPNPASNFVKINKSGSKTEFTVSIIELNGRVVSKRVLSDNESYVNVSDLANGIYFVKIEEGGNSIIKKLVIKK